ncbi:MAG: DNA repair protein RecO [Candidatus Brocadiaceae bacterium]|nr:DNA repair protein RecO [Candidatus Brocadiaceae bacterium]
MSILKTQAITLRRTDYSDSSQIITFYTRDYGKIKALAKGFKRSSGKYSSKAVDLLAYYRILFIKKERTRLHILTDALLQNNYPLLRGDIDKYYRASYVAELVSEFTEENEPNSQLFDIFLNTLAGISEDSDATIRLLVFEIKMLKNLGYLPEWRHCVCCKNEIRFIAEVYFNAKEGGALCNICRGKFRDGISVSVHSMVVAAQLSEIKVQKLERVKIQLSICIEIEKMLRYHIISILNKKLNSWKYITLAGTGERKI